MKVLLPGELLDRRYRIARPLGRGGFGQTYIAEDTRRPGNPKCVVKHLKPTNGDPLFFENAKRLFLTEAETLERLGNHDQIPRLLAYFEEDQEFYLVQELIEGHTLANELRSGQRWTESQVCQMLREVLNVLVFVHGHKVIHRDIKPDNIIRRLRDHQLVLVDFGIVKQIQTQLGPQSSYTVGTGTPGYMPSEQCRGKPRPNSDIYALGIIGIQAATGVNPSRLEEDSDTGEIVWHSWAHISDGLASILAKMVRYDFKDRYQSAGETLQALNLLVNHYPNLATDQSIPISSDQSRPIASEPAFKEEPAQMPGELPQPTGILVESPEALTATEVLPLQPSSHSQPEVVLPAPLKASASVPLVRSPSEPQPSVSPERSPALPAEAEAEATLVVSPQREPQPSPASVSASGNKSRLLIGVGLVAAIVSLIPGYIYTTRQQAYVRAQNTVERIYQECMQQESSSLPTSPPDYKYPNGSSYYGAIANGLPADGRGTITLFDNGSYIARYDGEFQDGKRNGCGTLTFANGRSYIGQFQNDMLNGQGVWTLENGDRYVGEFQDNKCNGQGTFIFANKSFESGVWQNGSLVGGTLSCDR